MKNYKIVIVILSLFVIFSVSANAQNKFNKDRLPIRKGSNVRIKMLDNTNFEGILLRSDDEHTVIRTTNGNMELLTYRIKRIEENNYEGKYGYFNPNYYNYIISPTGFALEKGKYHYKAILTDLHLVHYGVSDHFSIGVGTSITSLILSSPLLMVIPKVSFKINEMMHVGGEILSFALLLNNDEFLGGIGLAKVTYGNLDNNVSLGAGIAAIYNNDEFILQNSPTMLLSGMHRLNQSLYFISENYLIFVDDVQYAGVQGIRFTTRRSSFDLGAILIVESNLAIPIPLIGYSITF